MIHKDLSLQDILQILNKTESRMLFPNIRKIVLLSSLCPIGNAVVERLFSLLKITKTVLRNSLGDTMLDMLLRLNVEAPGTWTDDEKDELVELFKEKKARAGKAHKWKL